MRKIISFTIICTLVFICSCKDYLDVVPDNIATLDHSFNDRVGAERFLANCYSYLPNFGGAGSDPAILGSDEFWLHENESFYSQYYSMYGIDLKKNLQNVTDPLFNYWSSGNGGSKLFTGLRDCNIFLEKIGEVGDELSDADRTTWIAEVKFIKAYLHYYLLKLYGPIPLIKENLPISASVEEVQVYREPFDDCIDYIVALIDEAVPDLPLIVNSTATELGRITQPIALAVKAEVLVTAASPLFNGNADYTNVIDNQGRKLFNAEYDKEKWNRAMIACKNAIDTCLLGGHRFYSYRNPIYALSDTTQLLMTLRTVVTDKWNSELIWANSRNVVNVLERMAIPFFDKTQLSATNVSSNLAPTLNMAELFYTNNGVPIAEDNTYDYEGRYELTIAQSDHRYYISTGFQTPKLHLNREPRFYANLGFDGGIWYGNGRYNDVGVGASTTQPWVLLMKKGQTSGNTSNLKYSITGYYPKKLLHCETIHNPTTGGSPQQVRTTFPIIRLSDLYLLYAEAMNEYYEQPTAEVWEYVDIIRAKAGLRGVKESWTDYSINPGKPETKAGMREIIRQERLIELAFEGKRYWDLRRWKLAHTYYNQAVKGWNTDGAGNDFYIPKVLWTYTFGTKNYLWPIAETTLRADQNLVQNPYW
jgi:hypothetical protein